MRLRDCYLNYCITFYYCFDEGGSSTIVRLPCKVMLNHALNILRKTIHTNGNYMFLKFLFSDGHSRISMNRDKRHSNERKGIDAMQIPFRMEHHRALSRNSPRPS